MNAMKEMQPQRTHSVISEGFEFQANFDHYLAEDFQQPTISVDEIPDRDDQMVRETPIGERARVSLDVDRR